MIVVFCATFLKYCVGCFIFVLVLSLVFLVWFLWSSFLLILGVLVLVLVIHFQIVSNCF